MQVIDGIEKKENEKTKKGLLSRKIDERLKEQILVFKALISMVSFGISTNTLINLYQGKLINWGSIVAVAIFFVFYGYLYGIEHWDENDKLNRETIRKNQENLLESQKSVEKFVFSEIVPDLDTLDEKIKVLDALTRMKNLANVVDIKQDFAVLHTSVADALITFMDKVNEIKDEAVMAIAGLTGPPKQKTPTRKEVSAEELNKLISDRVDGGPSEQ